MAVSRRLRLRGEMERLFSRSFRNAASNGASISSKVNREGGLCRRFLASRSSRRHVSGYEALYGVRKSCRRCPWLSNSPRRPICRDKAWNVPRTLFLSNRVPRLVTKKKSEGGWPWRYWSRRDLYIDSTLRVEL